MLTACGAFGRVVSFKLAPGEDLMRGLIAVCDEHGIQNGIILSAFGSLESAVVKNVVAIEGVKYQAGYGDATQLEGPIELIGTTGVICHDDEGRVLPHVHITLSNRDALAFGGHLCEEGTRVKITVEGAIAEFEGINMRKVPDTERGILVFRPEQAQPGRNTQ